MMSRSARTSSAKLMASLSPAPQRGTQDFSRDRLLQGPLTDPWWEREAGSDFSGHCRWDEHFLEQCLQQAELSDPVEGDQGTGWFDAGWPLEALQLSIFTLGMALAFRAHSTASADSSCTSGG
jgi:hypothetical protein